MSEAGHSPPDVSPRALVVIPTWNEARHIDSVLRHFLNEAATLPLRIVVSDGGSLDGTQEKVRAIAADDGRVALLHNPARIQSAAINLAVERYGPEAQYLIRADAHAGYPEGFCRTLIEEAQATKASAVTVPMETRAWGCFQQGVAAAQNTLLGTGGSAHRMGKGGRWVDHGHHALMRLDAFRHIGGYDEAFSHNEDAEFDQRLRDSGGRIWLTEKTSVLYYPRDTASGLFRQYRAFGRGRAANMVKHRALPRLRQALPLAVAPGLLLLLLAFVAGIAGASGWMVTLMAVPGAAWAVVCLGYGALLGVRARRWCWAWSGPAAMIMHAAWSLGCIEQLAALAVGRER